MTRDVTLPSITASQVNDLICDARELYAESPSPGALTVMAVLIARAAGLPDRPFGDGIADAILGRRTASSAEEEAASWLLNREQQLAGQGEPGWRQVLEDAADCTCIQYCAEDPETACSLSGDWHVHPGEPCPVHPEAPGDHDGDCGCGPCKAFRSLAAPRAGRPYADVPLPGVPAEADTPRKTA